MPIHSLALENKNIEISQTTNQIGNNGSINKIKFDDASYDPFNGQSESTPAWAQGAYQYVEFNKLKPFGVLKQQSFHSPPRTFLTYRQLVSTHMP